MLIIILPVKTGAVFFMVDSAKNKLDDNLFGKEMMFWIIKPYPLQMTTLMRLTTERMPLLRS